MQHFGYASGDGGQINRSDFKRFVALVGSVPVIEGVPIQIAWAEHWVES